LRANIIATVTRMEKRRLFCTDVVFIFLRLQVQLFS